MPKAKKVNKSEKKFTDLEAFMVGKPEKPGILKSRHNAPMTIPYGGEAMVIAPRGKVKVDNYDLLGAIPKGVTLIKK